jgi:hypothetical protein
MAVPMGEFVKAGVYAFPQSDMLHVEPLHGIVRTYSVLRFRVLIDYSVYMVSFLTDSLAKYLIVWVTGIYYLMFTTFGSKSSPSPRSILPHALPIFSARRMDSRRAPEGLSTLVLALVSSRRQPSARKWPMRFITVYIYLLIVYAAEC